MKTILSFNYLQAEKDANKDLERNARLEYPMDLFIKEVKRINSGSAVITFTLSSSTNPEVASFSVSGELQIEGSDDEVSTALSPTGGEPPSIWKSIYNESVNIITLLAKVINVPFPASNIDVHLVSN
jgi:hypothetical protein